jgi:hypothetical protein
MRLDARKCSDVQVEASLQLSIYSYATAMNGLADEQDRRLRFDVLTWRERSASAARGPDLHNQRSATEEP